MSEERFGSYSIVKKIAAGGMAEVLLAKQTGIGGFERLVCLKRILPHLSSNEDFIKMFQDEARIAATLIHPNIAQIYEIGKENDTYFIAMEYVRGEDLRRIYNAEVKRGQALKPEVAAHAIMQAALGLDYAHKQVAMDGKPLGIVHRDISPQNILITYDGFIKLIDFGVAKAANKMAQTRSGVLKGKYSYMSPEQAAGETVDGRSDIFALGTTLYEITTGTRLFKRESELDTLQAVIACQVTPPSKVIPGYPSELEKIILKALSKNKNDRYKTAGHMSAALEHYLESTTWAAKAETLSRYMRELFADKLADELLIGAHPEESSAAPVEQPLKQQHPVSTSSETQPISERNNIFQNIARRFKHASQQTLANETTRALPHFVEPKKSKAIVQKPNFFQKLSYKYKHFKIWLQTYVAQCTKWFQRSTSQAKKKKKKTTIRYAWYLKRVLTACSLLGLLYIGYRYRNTVQHQAWPILQHAAQTTKKTFDAWLPATTKASQEIYGAIHEATQPQQPKSDELVAVEKPTTTILAHPTPNRIQHEPHESMPKIAKGEGILSLTSTYPLHVRIQQQSLGETPLKHIVLKAGHYTLHVSNNKDNYTATQDIDVHPHEHNIRDITPPQGTLVVQANPWAWVQFGESIPTETPTTLNLYSGNYKILLECPNGQQYLREAHITPEKPASLRLDCSK